MVDEAKWQALEDALKGLLQGEFSSAHLTYNDYRSAYLTAQDACDQMEYGFHAEDWVSEEERAFAIANESVWTLQWYPDTPVGSYVLSAGRLGPLLAAALKQ